MIIGTERNHALEYLAEQKDLFAVAGEIERELIAQELFSILVNVLVSTSLNVQAGVFRGEKDHRMGWNAALRRVHTIIATVEVTK